MEEGTAASVTSEPPPLPYSLRDRKKSIVIFWTIFVVDTLGQPLILYWTLWYLTDLSHNLGMFAFLEPFTVPGSVQWSAQLLMLFSCCSVLHRDRNAGRCLRV